MSYIRAIGSFVYSAIICAVFFIIADWLLLRIIILAEGFMAAVGTVCVFVFLAWLSERGISIASIPFNWLWDKSRKTRIASIIPPVIIGLWCATIPFRIALKYSFGDWLIIIIWEISVLLFYYNMITLPIINKNMGVGSHAHA